MSIISYRVFIAIALNQRERKAIASLMEKLRQEEAYKALKWVKPENLHLTLHFIGNLSKEKIDILIPLLNKLTHQFKPEILKPSALKLFPNKHHPRTLALEYDVPAAVKLVHEQMKDLLIQQTIAVESRPLRLHLSLARVRKTIKALPELSINLSDYQLTAEHIYLYQSTRDASGLVYIPLVS